MPEFSFRLPRFLRSRRTRHSDSPKSAPAGPCDDVAAPHSPPLGSSPALSSRPSSTHGTPKQAVYVGMATFRSPAPSTLIHLRASADRLCIDRAPGDTGGQPSQVSRSITPINVVDVNSVPKLSPQDSVASHPIHRPHISDSTGQHPSYSLVTSSQQQSPSGKDLPTLQHQSQGMFHQAHDLSATGNFIDGNVGSVTLMNFNNSNNFMEKLLKETMPGAAADSSARDPPPRCHPGTRLAILERCLHFIAHCNGVQKMRWIVGAAGVGKSAVMQNVAESPHLQTTSNASIFFSINGHNDGTKVIMTLSYQFAAKSKLYRQVIEGKVADDPRLLQSSMPVQFEKFIVQPFIHNTNLNSAGRVLIIIDGLDECNNTRTQVELLRLISNHCLSHPTSPLVWLIASRPEPHIAAFFSRPEVVPTYETEEITIDSDEARADVEQFLRHELTEIGRASDFLSSQWPDEPNLWKLAKAAGGLFAYAHTVIRYIGDSTAGDPVSQLSDVLNVIDQHPLSDVPRDQHPMALLDALYAQILSNVPPKIMMNARKLLLLLASNWDLALTYPTHPPKMNFIILCNWLGMTADETYAALNRLRSVLDFSQRHKAHEKALKPFHKSLIDHMFRSRFFHDIELEAQQIKTQCAFRVLKEAPDGIDFGGMGYVTYYGRLTCNGGTGDKISITWRVDEGIDWNDGRTRLSMYALAIGEVVAGMKRGDPVFQTDSCIKLLTTKFRVYWGKFPYRELCDFVFDKPRCHDELMKHGILKKLPAKAIDMSEVNPYFDSALRFHRLAAATTLPNPWNSSCKHWQQGQWEDGKEQSWTTVLDLDGCSSCFEKLNHQLETWLTQHPDHAVSIMFASAEDCFVEIRFVNPEDNVSEWTYRLWLNLTKSKLKELQSTI